MYAVQLSLSLPFFLLLCHSISFFVVLDWRQKVGETLRFRKRENKRTAGRMYTTSDQARHRSFVVSVEACALCLFVLRCSRDCLLLCTFRSRRDMSLLFAPLQKPLVDTACFVYLQASCYGDEWISRILSLSTARRMYIHRSIGDNL